MRGNTAYQMRQEIGKNVIFSAAKQSRQLPILFIPFLIPLL